MKCPQCAEQMHSLELIPGLCLCNQDDEPLGETDVMWDEQAATGMWQCEHCQYICGTPNHTAIAQVLATCGLRTKTLALLPQVEWRCPHCGTQQLPEYAELEIRASQILKIHNKIIYTGDTMDYTDPDDIPYPTHWLVCTKCYKRVEMNGYLIEPH